MGCSQTLITRDLVQKLEGSLTEPNASRGIAAGSFSDCLGLVAKDGADEVFHVAFGAGDGGFDHPGCGEPCGGEGGLYFLHSAQSHCLIADDAPVGLVVGRFELRFHQADEDRARAAEAGKEGGECCQADEGYVDDNEVEGCADLGCSRQSVKPPMDEPISR